LSYLVFIVGQVESGADVDECRGRERPEDRNPVLHVEEELRVGSDRRELIGELTQALILEREPVDDSGRDRAAVAVLGPYNAQSLAVAGVESDDVLSRNQSLDAGDRRQ